MVGPVDSRKGRGQRGPLGRELLAASEMANRSAHQGTRTQIANETEEVAARWIEPTDWERVVLGIGLIAIIANRLEREHRGDWLAPLAAIVGVDLRAHARILEIRRLFIDEKHEA